MKGSRFKRVFRNGLRLVKKGAMQIEVASSSLWHLEARLVGVECGRDVRFLGRPILGRHEDSLILLETGVCVRSALRSNPLGCFQPSILRTMASGARLELKKDVGISSTVLCAAKSIIIGEGTIIGAGAMIVDNDFHSPEGEWGWSSECVAGARPVTIGRGVFIGARAIVLKGVTIGDRAVIGAGAVVTRDVPSHGLAVGNPASLVLPRAKKEEPLPPGR